MTYTIIFTPYVATNSAQLVTTATVLLLPSKEELWSEPVAITVMPETTAEQVQQMLAASVVGFEQRVNAILRARELAKVQPVI